MSLALFFALIMAGVRGGPTFSSSPWLTVSLFGAVLSASAGGVLAAVAIAAKRERHWAVILAAIVGLPILAWFIGQVIGGFRG